MAIAERDFGADHPQALPPLNNLGMVLQQLGHRAEAEPYLRRALAITEQSEAQPNLPGVLGALAEALADAKRLDEAQQTLDRLIGLKSRDQARTAVAAYRLGTAYTAAGRHEDAATAYQTALDADTAAHGPDHPEVATILGALADAKRLDEALPRRQRAVEIIERAEPPGSDRLRQALVDLADMYRTLDQSRQAATALRRAVSVTEAARGPHAMQLLPLLRPLADALSIAGETGEAITVLERLAELHDWFGGYHSGVADDLRTLANLLLAQDRPADALPHLHTALDIDDKQDDLVPVIEDLTALVSALGLTGDHEEADQMRAELSTLTAEQALMSKPEAAAKSH